MFLNDICNRPQPHAVLTVRSVDTATTPTTADVGGKNTHIKNGNRRENM